jgi:hypothetical protein
MAKNTPLNKPDCGNSEVRKINQIVNTENELNKKKRDQNEWIWIGGANKLEKKSGNTTCQQHGEGATYHSLGCIFMLLLGLMLTWWNRAGLPNGLT